MSNNQQELRSVEHPQDDRTKPPDHLLDYYNNDNETSTSVSTSLQHRQNSYSGIEIGFTSNSSSSNSNSSNNNNSIRTGESTGMSTEEMANAFSTSLANIAAAGVRRSLVIRHEQEQLQQNLHLQQQLQKQKQQQQQMQTSSASSTRSSNSGRKRKSLYKTKSSVVNDDNGNTPYHHQSNTTATATMMMSSGLGDGNGTTSSGSTSSFSSNCNCPVETAVATVTTSSGDDRDSSRITRSDGSQSGEGGSICSSTIPPVAGASSTSGHILHNNNENSTKGIATPGGSSQEGSHTTMMYDNKGERTLSSSGTLLNRVESAMTMKSSVVISSKQTKWGDYKMYSSSSSSTSLGSNNKNNNSIGDMINNESFDDEQLRVMKMDPQSSIPVPSHERIAYHTSQKMMMVTPNPAVEPVKQKTVKEKKSANMIDTTYYNYGNDEQPSHIRKHKSKHGAAVEERCRVSSVVVGESGNIHGTITPSTPQDSLLKEQIKRSSSSTSTLERERTGNSCLPSTTADRDKNDIEGDDSGGSSGSGTEHGYAASSSTNGSEEKRKKKNGSCSSSPSSEDSSCDDDSGLLDQKQLLLKHKFPLSGDPNRPMLRRKFNNINSKSNTNYDSSVSSEIADFSSTNSAAQDRYDEDDDDDDETPSISSSFSSNGCNTSDDDDDDDIVEQGQNRQRTIHRNVNHNDVLSTKLQQSAMVRQQSQTKLAFPSIELARQSLFETYTNKKRRGLQMGASNMKHAPMIQGKPAIMAIGSDVMAHVLTFLEPPDILNVLTMPLSKDWLCTFTRQPELWRVLCLLDPFKANIDNDVDDDHDSCFPFMYDTRRKQVFGKFRLLYTSFVRCMRYLARIKDDAVNGRTIFRHDARPLNGPYLNIGANRNLQQLLSRARGVIDDAAAATAGEQSTESTVNPAVRLPLPLVEQVARAAAVNLNDEKSLANGGGGSDGSVTSKKEPNHNGAASLPPKKKVKYGHSKLTQRLLGPASNGAVRDVDLPWSCGIYSIINWMVAFADVEGIQTMSLKVLPFLLENEQQRITAQRAGLTDIVLRAMVLFPESTALHTAAFHTIVLLARPLGGQEGMLFHTSMVNASGIFCSQESATDGRNGIAVLLDSMSRFRSDKLLQSMSCWSLVNIALAPAQKEVLVKLGGIEATAKAMLEHPFDAEVQFRALFALINLVIPSVSLNTSTTLPPHNHNINNSSSTLSSTSANTASLLNNDDDQSEREMLDEMVTQIVQLVVASMKNFCSNEAILNRACLVLHNLSLTSEYHEVILWTPDCYQMLEWCLANYRTDHVLQQSASGTLHRLQTTLSRNDSLRVRFAISIQAQQRTSLERAHAEAQILHEQYNLAAAAAAAATTAADATAISSATGAWQHEEETNI